MFVVSVWAGMKVSVGLGGRVAVIGAGAGGLCAARNLRDFGMDFRVTVYEADSVVGGTWNYTDKTGVHSSMYKSLRTNLPKQVMAYPSFPFDDELASYPGHDQVAEYLRRYMERYDLGAVINFNSEVLRVSRDDSSDCWLVRTRRGEEEVVEQQFDAVVVCNGHYTVPHRPHLVGMNTFRGKVVHSHDYREPEMFRDKVVVVLGAGPSGVDIALEIASTAKAVYLSHRGYKNDEGPLENLHQRPAICGLDGNVITFEDQRQVEADYLMLCTGYEYRYPFIDPDVGLRITDRVVHNLYRHLLYIPNPTLSFVGLPWKIAPFPLMDFQTRYVTAVLSGEITLPSQADMEKELENEVKHRSHLPDRYFHMFAEDQWEYNRRLAEEVGIDPLPPVLKRIYADSSAARRSNPLDYRQREYIVLGDNDFRVEHIGAGDETAV